MKITTLSLAAVFFFPLGLLSAADTAKPLKVFILAGQSNMQGQGIVTSKDKAGKERPGTLAYLLKDPAKAPMLKKWVDAKGEWAEKRDDVWCGTLMNLVLVMVFLNLVMAGIWEAAAGLVPKCNSAMSLESI